MKANPGVCAFRFPLVVATAALLALAGCSERRVIPPPAPSPTPTPTPTRAPPPANWRDAPITPGDWSWSKTSSGSIASFAGGQLVLRCEAADRVITLLRAGSGTGQVPMTVLTEAVTKPLTGTPQDGSPSAIAVRFSARDPLLDAMAFSRGRFAIETAGLPTIYAPSWAEVSRVIEDCR